MPRSLAIARRVEVETIDTAQHDINGPLPLQSLVRNARCDGTLRVMRSAGSQRGIVSLRGSGALCLLAGAAILSSGSFVRAEDGRTDDEAMAAYDRGATAYERGDVATAAVELARADALSPNPVALESALRAALEANAPDIGMELAARAKERGAGGDIATLAREATKRFEGRVGTLRVTCPDKACRVSLDGAAFAANEDRFVRVGKHIVWIERGGSRQEIATDVAAGARVTVGPSASPGDPPGRSSRVWFFVGLGATALGGVAITASGLRTRSIHEDFVTRGCPGSSSPSGCADLANEGQSAQTLTNALVGVTAALGAATIVAGALTLGSRDDSAPRLSLETGGGKALARITVPLP